MNFWEKMYNLGIHLALPVVIPGHYRAFKGRNPDQHTQKRFVDGMSEPLEKDPELWLHGASVGEMQLVRKIRDWAVEEGLEGDRILVTAQTLSGLESIDHPVSRLLPADYPSLLDPLSDAVGEAPLIVVETEIWPNLFRFQSGNVHIFNGHLKPESFQSYCRLKPLFRSALGYCRSISARSEDEARRFRVLSRKGDRDKISAPGDLKWTKILESPDPSALEGPRFRDDSPVLVAGSTWPGEELRVIDLVEQYDLNLYLAPRHMDRLGDVEDLLDESNCSWTTWTGGDETVDVDIVLVDTIGVLSELYGRGDVVFVGGSWADGVGGHDVLEPARFGVRIWVGPHIANIRETADQLATAGMLRILEGESDWDREMNDFLNDESTADFKQGFQRITRRAEAIRDDYKQRLRSILNGDDFS